LYHCFGCSAHVDAFEFISQIEGSGFKEALERSASVTGAELSKYRVFKSLFLRHFVYFRIVFVIGKQY